MLTHVAACAERHQVIERVVAQLATLDFVVDLQVLQRSAFLTAPFVPLQHPLHKPPVNLFSQLDPLYLIQHFPAVSNSLPLPWLARFS